MVDQTPDRLDAVFHALADRTRRAMLQQLAHEPMSVGALAAPFDMSLAAASKHIKVLERAGLVERSVRGRSHLCRLDARAMHGGMEWLRHYERFWNQRLDALAAALEADATSSHPPARRPRGSKSPRPQPRRTRKQR